MIDRIRPRIGARVEGLPSSTLQVFRHTSYISVPLVMAFVKHTTAVLSLFGGAGDYQRIVDILRGKCAHGVVVVSGGEVSSTACLT